jgi:hypothetical protein
MRIVWNNQEKSNLHDCMVDICYTNSGLPSKQLLRMAQEECIAPDRRLVITDQRVFSYKALIASARDLAAKHRRSMEVASKQAPPPPPPEPPPPAPNVERLTTMDDFMWSMAHKIAVELFKLQQLDAQTLGTKEVASQEETTRYEQVPPEIQRQQGFGTSWLKRLDEAVRIRKRSVLIIGLNGCQMETIRQYRPDLDYTFINSDDAISRYTVHKDHTILMTKFINHSVQNKYRKHPNLHYCNGGVGDLKTLLQGIFSKEMT